MNYQPDEIARSLLRKQSNILGLIIPNVSHPFFSQLADRVMRRDRFNCRATHATMAVSAAPLLRSGWFDVYNWGSQHGTAASAICDSDVGAEQCRITAHLERRICRVRFQLHCAVKQAFLRLVDQKRK
ncbi:hypothetical protein D3C75_634240 [compost metagenome]